MCLCLLQVLERWCTSPRTIEVLMNTYSVVQLSEEAMALVPPETLEVRSQDLEHTQSLSPAPRDSHLLLGSSVGSPTLPLRIHPETFSCPRRRKLTEPTPKMLHLIGSRRHLLATSLPALGGMCAICPRLPC